MKYAIEEPLELIARTVGKSTLYGDLDLTGSRDELLYVTRVFRYSGPRREPIYRRYG